MNLAILSSEIVRRVKDSPDSVVNLEIVVAGLIRSEQDRERQIKLGNAIDETNSLLKDFARDFGSK